jgi:molybdopterin-binding protein
MAGDMSRSAPVNGRFIGEEVHVLSARNQFQGTVKSVKLGEVMAEVIVSVGNLEIVSAITRTSAESLKLKPGDTVKAVIKSTEVLIDK